MWAEFIAGGGFIGLVSLILGRQYSRMNKIESNQKKALYQSNGQTHFVPRSECTSVQKTFCDKIDEVKVLIINMDTKREETKDEDHEAHRMIGERLAAIEAKLT